MATPRRKIALSALVTALLGALLLALATPARSDASLRLEPITLKPFKSGRRSLSFHVSVRPSSVRSATVKLKGHIRRSKRRLRVELRRVRRAASSQRTLRVRTPRRAPAGRPKLKLDQTPPETTIDSGPAANSPAGEPVTFVFKSSERKSSFQCKLSSWSSWRSCDSPQTYESLNAGNWAFNVRATDRTGNVDETPASYSFSLVDRAPPETTIDSGPSDDSTAGEPVTFAFHASEQNSTFECKLDGWSEWQNCANPESYDLLGAGDRTFEVRATDELGNVDETPAEYPFTLVTSEPDPQPAPEPDPEPTPEADPGPGGDLSVGNLIAADDASSSPIPLWHEFCALSLSSSTQERLAARHSYHAGGGPHDGPYRELSYQDGDDCYNERTELGANSQRPSETFQVYREGDRKLTEGWFRFPDSYNGRGGGWQMKQAATGSNSSHYAEPPVLRLEMVESRWVLRHSVDRNPITLWQSEPNPRQEWLHMALDVTYSQDPSEGRIVVYEGSDAKPLSKVAEITGYATLLTEENTGAATPQGGAMPSHLRAGIYQRLAYGDNTMDLGPTRVYGIR